MSRRKNKIRKPRFIRFAHERTSTGFTGDFDKRDMPAMDAPAATQERIEPVILEPETEIPLDHAEDPVSVAEDMTGDAPELEEVDAIPQVITTCKLKQGQWWLFTMQADGDFKMTDGPFDDEESCEAMRPDRDTNMTDKLP